MSADDVAHVRRVLLGLEGPYADPRVATDALDNLAEWVEQLDSDGRRALAATLVALVHDDDASVATGAVLALRHVAANLDTATTLDATAALDAPDLDRSPVGFAGASATSLRGELAIALMSAIARHHPRLARELLTTPPAGATRIDLGMAAAPAAPDLIVEHAAEWFDPATEPAVLGVLLRLPTHWHRIAMSGACAPWPADAHSTVDQAARWQGWADGDTDALHRAMTGTDPFLNRPGGVDDGRRWRIIGGTPYGWTLWRSDDGTMAFEVLDDGPAMTTTTRLLTPEEVGSVREHGASVAADW
jgi:hypothetical protein